MKTLALAAALCLFPTLSFAQTPPAATAPRPRSRFDAPVIPVDGVIAHPYFWIHTRSAPRYVPADPRRSFTPTVVQAVRRDPF